MTEPAASIDETRTDHIILARREELARWRGIVDTRLQTLQDAQYQYGKQLARIEGHFEASLKRLHEDVCTSLRHLEGLLQQERTTQAAWQGGLSLLHAVVPLAAAALGAVVAFLLIKK